ncbi:hypothetical protein LPAF129_13250 [Ligilactobacillus pabuli]|uniref:Uncharacterized protein n=1 Tax=Ligilactobacillus pabuli TaxID=2886039 RepID=A0ABQ5JHT2_9LACO|nr:hypothetical protein LPAF129_13250 [Ligilactobacillus pabuli]
MAEIILIEPDVVYTTGGRASYKLTYAKLEPSFRHERRLFLCGSSAGNVCSNPSFFGQ